VCCAAYEGVKIVVSDAEIHIDSIEHILGQILENVLCHFDVDVAHPLVLRGTVTNLNSGRVEWCIGVLITGHEYDVPEP
jgi:arginase family enzyme